MRSGIGRLRRHSVVIHTQDESIFKGVLVESFHDCLVLANPILIDPSQEQVENQEEPLGGKAVIPRTNVAWLQVL